MTTYLLALFLALQIGDFLTTRKALSLGASEGNPLVRGLMKKIGTDRALAIFKLIGCLAGYVAYSLGPAWLLGVITVAMAGIVVNNLLMIRRLGGAV